MIVELLDAIHDAAGLVINRDGAVHVPGVSSFDCQNLHNVVGYRLDISHTSY